MESGTIGLSCPGAELPPKYTQRRISPVPIDSLIR